jgi:hypothetical protein
VQQGNACSSEACNRAGVGALLLVGALFRRPSNLHCMAKWRPGGHGQMCLGGIRELPHLWG